jgi:hypothetical protein
VDPLSLTQAGPVAILLAGIYGLWRAFVRGDIVPGSLYREAIARAEKAETQAERNTDALEAVTATVKQALEQRAAGPGGHADA